MSEPIKLPILTAPMTNAGIAHMIREVADEIEAGEFNEVNTAIVCLNSDTHTGFQAFGPRIDPVSVSGVLFHQATRAVE